jgi:hypothetical protein
MCLIFIKPFITSFSFFSLFVCLFVLWSRVVSGKEQHLSLSSNDVIVKGDLRIYSIHI